MNMSDTVGFLEVRVIAAAELIGSLREQVHSLERELARAQAEAAALPPAAPPRPADSSLVEELERLRAERLVIRDKVRGLIREIDRVSW